MKEYISYKKTEILAPAGTFESMRAAVNAGADAVYLGGDAFGARANAGNFDKSELLSAIDFAHLHRKKIYLTVNTLLKERELNDRLYEYLLPFYQEGLDAVIVQDMGVLKFIRENFPDLSIHASTQMTITGRYGAELLKRAGASRIVTARELSFDEIKEITNHVDIEVESFVHGALCYCYSGQCLLSSMIGGRSGNRGRCAQPCRLFYDVNMAGCDAGNLKGAYVLSPKDMCTLAILPRIIDSGVFSLKIEGRMKSSVYTAAVVEKYRKYTDMYLDRGIENYRVSNQDLNELMDIYNRGGFSEGYYNQHNGKHMISIDRPNHMGTKALTVLDNIKGKITFQALEEINQGDVFEVSQGISFTSGNDIRIGDTFEVNLPSKYNIKKKDILYRTKNRSFELSIQNKYIDTDKIIKISGILNLKPGEAADFTVGIFQNGILEDTISVAGDVVEEAQNQPLTEEKVEKQLKKTGGSGFEFEKLEIHIAGAVFVPVQSLNELRRYALEQLKEHVFASHRREGQETSRPVKTEVIDRKRNSIHVFLSDPAHLEEVLKCGGVDMISLDTASFWHDGSICENIIKCKRAGKKVYLKLPFILRKAHEESVCETVKKSAEAGADGFIIKNIDELYFMNRMADGIFNQIGLDTNLILDYNVYVFNSMAKEQYEESAGEHVNIISYTIPLELNGNELSQMNLDAFEMVVYGKAPVMVSAQCVRKTAADCDGQNRLCVLTDRKKAEFLSQSFCRYCYNVTYNSKALYLLDKLNRINELGIKSLRLEFTDETLEETRMLLDKMNESLIHIKSTEDLKGNYTRGNFLRGVE